jgi:hypothetical protein
MTVDSTPESSKEAFANAMKHFFLRFSQGWTDEQIVDDVVSHGLMQRENAETAVPIARKMFAPYQNAPHPDSESGGQEAPLDPSEALRRAAAAQRGLKRMWTGFLWLALGSLITWGTYSAASSSQYGGTYTICYGAIGLGGLYFLWGLMEWLSNR